MFVENNTFTMKFFEIERLLNKWKIKKRESKYLIRWKNCELKKNVWKNIFELNDAMNLIREYENVLNIVIFTISNRLQKLVINLSSKRLKLVVVSKFDVISNEQKFVVIISSRKFFANFFVVKTRKFFANVFIASNLLIFFIDVMIF